MTYNTCDHCQRPIVGHAAAMSFHGTVTRDLCHACYKAFTAWCGEAPTVPVVAPAVVRVRHIVAKAKPKRRR